MRPRVSSLRGNLPPDGRLRRDPPAARHLHAIVEVLHARALVDDVLDLVLHAPFEHGAARFRREQPMFLSNVSLRGRIAALQLRNADRVEISRQVVVHRLHTVHAAYGGEEVGSLCGKHSAA